MMLLARIACASALLCHVLWASNNYDDDLSRNKLFPMSAAAYSLHPERCIQRKLGSEAFLVNNTDVSCDSGNNTCGAFVAVSPNDHAIILAFRGTATIDQLKNEGLSCAFPTNMVKVEIGGKVCKYFWEAFLSTWQRGGIRNDLVELRKKFPLYGLWITGHSLGGGLASLAAAVILHAGLFRADEITAVTYGTPRVGDDAFATAHSKMIPHFYLVVHESDPVPHIPSYGYFHHLTNVCYNNNMMPKQPFEVSSQPEVSNCTWPLFENTLPSRDCWNDVHCHTWYFHVKVSEYGERGCFWKH